ncbi:hypothetical protein [Brevibacillus sp. H7]|uniref:hypothetical protein n=1 Tax=Brevibacillus sp. H7 TaxID=3349138 RepID=UPI0038258385
MNVKTRFAVISSILIVAVMIGVAIGISTQDGQALAQKNSNQYHGHESIFSNDIFGTTNRDKILICVDNLSSDKSNDISNEKLVKKIGQQLEMIGKKDKRWKEVGYHDVQVEVKAGCSFTPYLLEDNITHPIYGKGDYVPRRVKIPSAEQLGIFVVDQETIDKNFLGHYSRWSPEESVCEGHECNEVTKGIYFSPDEVKDFIKGISRDPMLYKELLHGLSLESVMPPVDEEQQKKDREEKEKWLKNHKANN